VAADVVGFAVRAASENLPQGLGVVANVEPIADIHAVAVHGNGFAGQATLNNDWNQLFRKLIRAVIVRAIGNDRRKAVGVVIGANQHVTGGFAGRIRGIGSVRGGLQEMPRSAERAVNFIGGNMMKTAGSRFLLAEPEKATGFEQVESANDVGLDEVAGAADRTVHVRFSRQMENVRDAVFLEDAENRRFIAQVHFFKGILGMLFDGLKVRKMAGVGQAIQIDQSLNFGPVNNVMNEIRADEARAAGDEEVQTSPPTDLVAMSLIALNFARKPVAEVEAQVKRKIYVTLVQKTFPEDCIAVILGRAATMSEPDLRPRDRAEPNADGAKLSDDVRLLHSMGYAQELPRRRSGFSNFAILFSIICILAGGITSLQLGVSAVGGAAAGVVWPVGVLFSLVVALCTAQIASAFPTADFIIGVQSWAGGDGGLDKWEEFVRVSAGKKRIMAQAVQIKVEMPGDLARFRLPKGVQERLLALLDKQDHGQKLTAAERREAEGLVDLTEVLSLLRLRAQRVRGQRS
jgi:hypothetical protein